MAENTQKSPESAELEVEQSSLKLSQSEDTAPQNMNLATGSIGPDNELSQQGGVQTVEYQYE